MRCGRSFSDQTFRPDYWLKRPDLLPLIFRRILSCSSFRQIAREESVAHATIQRQAERLGRHCLLFQQAWRARVPGGEPIVIDGFESFERSQYRPFHFHVAVGAESHYFHAFTDSELRRHGRMTSTQRKRRAELERREGRPDPRSIEKEVAELLRMLPRGDGPVRIRCDGHPAYVRAFRRVGFPIVYSVTSSKARRDNRNPLFPVNWLELLIRHGSSNHKRETIAFSKRRQNAAERLAILQVWRNFVKPFTEKHRGPPPAVRLGLTPRPLEVDGVLERRLFPSRIALPERLAVYYRRDVDTRGVRNPRRHRARFAE